MDLTSGVKQRKSKTTKRHETIEQENNSFKTKKKFTGSYVEVSLHVEISIATSSHIFISITVGIQFYNNHSMLTKIFSRFKETTEKSSLTAIKKGIVSTSFLLRLFWRAQNEKICSCAFDDCFACCKDIVQAPHMHNHARYF